MKEQEHSASVEELSHFNGRLRLPDDELGQLVGRPHQMSCWFLSRNEDTH